MSTPDPSQSESKSPWGIWLPLLSTVVIFLLRLPRIDIPVWDDGVIFFNGYWLLQGKLFVLDPQWHPSLVVLSAILNFILPAYPIVGFFVFMLIAHVTVAVGAYAMLRSLTYTTAEATALSTMWVLFIHTLCVIADFPTLHLYHTGVPLLIYAYLIRKRPVSIPLVFGLMGLSFLFRNESILVAVVLAIAGWWRRGRTDRISWKENRWSIIVISLFLLAILAVLLIRQPNTGSGRLTYAFSQSFYRYSLATLQYDAVPPPTRDREIHTLAQAFGEDAYLTNVFDLFLRNPVTFVQFMYSNVEVAGRGDWFGNHHYILGWLITLSIIAALLSLLVSSAWYRNLFLLLLLAAAVIKWPLYLITVPRFYYTADVMLILLFGVWKLAIPRYGSVIATRLAGVFLLVAFVSLGYGPHWETTGRPNLERALFVRETINDLGLTNVRIVERYGPFSMVFATRDIVQSNSMRENVYRMGNYIYSPENVHYDLVLIENQGRVMREDIHEWARHQTPVAQRGPYSLYWQRPDQESNPLDASPEQPIWVTDTFFDASDLVGWTDHDSGHNRQLTIKWKSLQEMGLVSGDGGAMVYVAESESAPFQLLAHVSTNEESFLEWKRGTPSLEPEFADGPQFMNDYRFQVKLSADSAMSVPSLTHETHVPVRFRSFLTVHDDLDSEEDISGSVDIDAEAERGLVLRWHLDADEVDPAAYNTVHVYYRTGPDGELNFIGRNLDPEQTWLHWRADAPGLHPPQRSGPQPGIDYHFLIYVATVGVPDSPYPAYHAAAPVRLEIASPE